MLTTGRPSSRLSGSSSPNPGPSDVEQTNIQHVEDGGDEGNSLNYAAPYQKVSVTSYM